MRIQTDGTLLHGAKLLFLDTAAWSYMESGSAPAATTELRALCADGRTRILVTADHLTEVGGLTTGRESRLAFMHAFPGTMLLPVGGAQMTKLGAFAFAFRALGENMEPQPLPCTEMRTESLAGLTKMVGQTLPLRLAHQYQAWASSLTFNRTTKETKEHREMITKLLRLARTGDVDAVVDYARQRKPFGRVGTFAQVLAARALVSLFRWGNERGILSSSAKTDFLFDQYVSSALPKEFSSNPDLMGPLFQVWTKTGALAAFSRVRSLERTRLSPLWRTRPR